MRFINKKFVAKIVINLEQIRWKYIYDNYRNKYSIDDTFKFNGIGVTLYGEGKIILKKNSYVGNFTAIQSSEGCKVIVEENCAISHNVRIYTENRKADDIIFEKDMISSRKGDVIIGANTWIGANVFIVEGVKIGNNCVVGANSVVTKSIPDNSIVGGVPAKIIKNKNSKMEEKNA